MKISFFLALLVFIFSFSSAYAAENNFITIVNPIRGADFFQLEGITPVTHVKNQWEIINNLNLSATWLIRPDALLDQDVTSLIKEFPVSQEKGLFLEITPTWAKKSEINYHQSANWHDAGVVFLTGYEVEERKKLIDTAFTGFKDIFGYYPKTVGAWWIDAGSLTYMKEKYGILANMDVADQYSTDNYQVWGQYFSTPFYPAKRNALVPASGIDQKIGIVTIQWATRDPFNSYGNGVLDSTYSVQANDYANKKYHNLDINYFKKLLSIYLDNPYSQINHVTVGMENDFSWEDYGQEYLQQLSVVSGYAKAGTKVVTVSDFADAYKNLFPLTSPEQIIFAKDPLGSDGAVLWIQNLKYRVGWFYNFKGSVIRDLRLYRDSFDEPCLNKSCSKLNLAMIENRNVDEVTFGDSWVIDEGKISDIKLKKSANSVTISYLNQFSHKRVIEFLENDIKIDSVPRPITVAINEAIDAGRNISKIDYQFKFNLKDSIGETLYQQAKNMLVFIIFSLFAFYLPGLAILKKVELGNNTKFILSFVIGIAIFTSVSFVALFTKLPWIMAVLPVISLILVRHNLIWPKIILSKESFALGAVLLIGFVSWLLTSVKNGLVYDYGLGFWGPHGHDAIWHLSLTENLKSLPLESPIFSGTNLQNYHYFYDLLLSQTSFWTNIPPIDLYFRMFPILITLLLGIVAFMLAKAWLGSYNSGLLAVFFLYFGGSFGWALSYFKNSTLGGETTFWAQQSISTLINPPFAISVLIFLTGLFLFYKIMEQKNSSISLIIPLIILWGSLIEFKVYAGILVLGSLGFLAAISAIRNNFLLFKIFIPTLFLSMIFFLPNNIGSPSLLVLSPLWLIHSMVDSPDRLGWVRLTLARIAGIETGNWFKLIVSEIMGLGIFFLGNLGTRVLGLLSLNKLWPLNSFNLFIGVFLLLSIILPLSFIQKGANYNIVQFFYYQLAIFNFLTAASLVWMISKWQKIGWLITIIAVLLTLPTTWDTLHHYLPSRPPARISLSELEALEFLKKQPKGVVLSHFYDNKLKLRFTEPIPIYAYESTAYVSAFSEKPEFISNTVNLEILGVDYKGRLQAQKDVMAQKEPEIVKMILKENNISYIYTPKIYGFSPNLGQFGLERIFENEEVDIFRVAPGPSI